MSAPGLLDFEWRLPAGVRAAFTTRLAGASAAPWDSFNLAAHVGDDPSHVAVNRARLRELLGLSTEPAWLQQVHGTRVASADEPFLDGPPVVADAAVATRRGAACVVMVADCLPVLLATRDGSAIAAAHAGWRGLAAGVVEETVRAIGSPGSQLTAWLGPAISRKHFEVGDEVREDFVSKDAGASSAFTRNTRGRWQADLVSLARRRLAALGVTDVNGGTWCTFSDRERFFSHRRDAQKLGSCGRMAALIWRD
jgi:YfiH family protein